MAYCCQWHFADLDIIASWQAQRPIYKNGGFRQEKNEPSFKEAVMQYIQNFESRFQNIEAQLGHITELLSQRAPGTLASQPEANPKGNAKAIKLRSGREVENSDEKEVVIKSNPKVPTDGNSEEKEESSKNDKVEVPKKENLMEDTLGKLLTFGGNLYTDPEEWSDEMMMLEAGVV
ncbi:hypothetical protein SESBI_42982 [Sesbania bispinosa]|nr:hypothetical protein SESBI_42982 [Sesbania bispinosa]